MKDSTHSESLSQLLSLYSFLLSSLFAHILSMLAFVSDQKTDRLLRILIPSDDAMNGLEVKLEASHADCEKDSITRKSNNVSQDGRQTLDQQHL